VVAPGLAVLALGRARRMASRAVLIGFAACSLGGVLLSGTRTNALIAVATMLVAGLLMSLSQRDRRRAAAVWVAIGVVGLAFAGGAAATGVSERLAASDAPHVGLNFRKDEAKTLLRLPTRDLLLGQGIGGTFISKDVNGRKVRTGWAHTFPLWLLLKAGVVGALAALFLLGAAIRAGWTGVRGGRPRVDDVNTGLVMLFGVLAISFTLGRAALPEGVALIGIAAALLGRPREASP
jgi:hypothetical protein